MPIILQFRDCPDSNDIAGSRQMSLHFGLKTVIYTAALLMHAFAKAVGG
ncbi:MAG TPA: hypothetical protein VK775_16025 [Chthoniobacterales bacterium]|jgi:hypothetical protein|nr:hypothetical protein [Chthoniobacterales bacterium]